MPYSKERAREYAKQYYEANKEKAKAYYTQNQDKMKAYAIAYSKAHKAACRKHHDKYAKSHPDKIRAIQYKYNMAHYDKIQKINKKYYEKNKYKIRAKLKKYYNKQDLLFKHKTVLDPYTAPKDMIYNYHVKQLNKIFDGMRIRYDFKKDCFIFYGNITHIELNGMLKEYGYSAVHIDPVKKHFEAQFFFDELQKHMAL